MLTTGRNAVVKPVFLAISMLAEPTGRSMATSTIVMMTAVVIDRHAVKHILEF